MVKCRYQIAFVSAIFLQFIEYKALQERITVVEATEEYTSKTCSKCGEISKRPRQDLIICPHGHMLNADINACRNLVKRFIDHWLVNGAVLRPPKTSPMDSLNPMMREESHDFNRVESQIETPSRSPLNFKDQLPHAMPLEGNHAMPPD